MTESLFRKLPAIDRLLETSLANTLFDQFGREAVTRALREQLDQYRHEIKDGAEKDWDTALTPDAVVEQAAASLADVGSVRLKRVINGTGVILHTGLGRAPLPQVAIDAIREEQQGYSLLEVQRQSGERGKRESRVVDLIQRLTGAEMAVVVNNNAAATFLCLSALAKGREVAVSRGQLVEIGESFRIPEVMAASGATMREVGSTNKTHLKDYNAVINDQTAILLRVHTSNYRIMGFTEEVPVKDLVSLAHEHDIVMMDDLGSGSLVDWTRFGLKDEPTVQDSLASGADVVTFSGDKLLGGPQAGIIVGKKKHLEKIRRHPMYRALRLDKLVLTALEATLLLYAGGEDHLAQHLPVYRMITGEAEPLKPIAEKLAEGISSQGRFSAEVVEAESQIGGGSIPVQARPTWAVAVTDTRMSSDELAEALRMSDPIVFTRIHNDRVMIDVRTLVNEDLDDLVAIFSTLASY